MREISVVASSARHEVLPQVLATAHKLAAPRSGRSDFESTLRVDFGMATSSASDNVALLHPRTQTITLDDLKFAVSVYRAIKIDRLGVNPTKTPAFFRGRDQQLAGLIAQISRSDFDPFVRPGRVRCEEANPKLARERKHNSTSLINLFSYSCSELMIRQSLTH
jgi:hypothetical protein